MKAEPKHTQNDIVLVTGQSGIKVDDCLKKIVNPDQILKIEKRMIEIFRKEIKPEMMAANDKEIMTEILSSPPFIQKQIWDSSFDTIKAELKRVKTNVGTHFITFHACFYHQRKREFISPINFSKLLSLQKRIRMVIVLVDDCYDIYRRLLGKSEMFYEDVMSPEIKPREAMAKSILNLLTILSWRELEVAFSRKISETTNVPFFVVAVKHPAIMVKKLIAPTFKKLKIFYLGHPITSVRKRAYARTSVFPSNSIISCSIY